MIYAYHVFDIITDLLIIDCMSKDLLDAWFGTSEGWFRLVVLFWHLVAGMLLFWHKLIFDYVQAWKMPWFAMWAGFIEPGHLKDGVGDVCAIY